jgi:hypothetical protein
MLIWIALIETLGTLLRTNHGGGILVMLLQICYAVRLS